MSVNDNLFNSALTDFAPQNSVASHGAGVSAINPFVIPCPGCAGDLDLTEIETGWQICPYCQKQMQIRVWPVVRQNTNAAAALSDQATCFFHPDKAFQSCCHRCGRFVCALCDLQLGAEHVCPTCFERGRAESGAEASKAEWRYRDVLYDSIAVTVGWGWILFWPTFVVALPAVIFLHVKYRRAPRSYLLPRYGWRFWMAYVGLAWMPLLLAGTLFPLWLRRH